MTAFTFELNSQPWLRCVNFHHTAHHRAAELERLFASLAQFFAPVTAADLAAVIETGRWHKDKPGLLPAFFNGYRDNYAVAYKLLEQFKMVGWFFVVTDFISLAPAQQLAFSKAHRFSGTNPIYPDERLALSWDEIHEMSAHHVICSHTASHSTVLDDKTDPAILEHEILGSAQAITRVIGESPPAFCWLMGEPYASCPAAHSYLKSAGYRFMFGSRRIEMLV